MATNTTTVVTHTCDRCGKQHIGGERPPGTEANNWATLRWSQNSGFDYSGAPWAERMPNPILLCGECADDVAAAVNSKRNIKALAAVAEAVEALADPEGRLVGVHEGPERDELERAMEARNG